MTKNYEKTGIYTITSVAGKQYVGSAVNFSLRWNVHKHCLRKGNHHNKPMQNAWNKHGEDYFTFKKIIFCEKEDLIIYEQLAMDALKPKYNVLKIAGNSLGFKHTEESLKKMVASQNNRERIVSDETRKRLSVASKGRISRPEDNKRRSDSLKGIPHTEERRQKNRESRLGRFMGKDNPKSKTVRCLETGMVFSSMREAADWMNENGYSKCFPASISDAVSGKTKGFRGTSWELVNRK